MINCISAKIAVINKLFYKIGNKKLTVSKIENIKIRRRFTPILYKIWDKKYDRLKESHQIYFEYENTYKINSDIPIFIYGSSFLLSTMEILTPTNLLCNTLIAFTLFDISTYSPSNISYLCSYKEANEHKNNIINLQSLIDKENNQIINQISQKKFHSK